MSHTTPGPTVEDDPVSAGSSSGVGASGGRPKIDPKRVLKAAIPLAILLALILSDIPLCPSKNFFGIPCPGCGLTRATEAMVMGDFATMLLMHPLAPIITPLAIYTVGRTLLVSAGLISGRSKDWLVAYLPKAIWPILAVAVLGLWIARVAGYLGGHPDPIDFTDGWIARGFAWVWNLFA